MRLPAEMVEAIDAECSRRAGNVSRNTWITEAVQEKLARNGAAGQSTSAGEGALCGTCMDARGLNETDMVEGAQRSTLTQLADWTSEADKVLVF